MPNTSLERSVLDAGASSRSLRSVVKGCGKIKTLLVQRVHAVLAIVGLCLGVSLMFLGCRFGGGHAWGAHSDAAPGWLLIEWLSCDGQVYFVLVANRCSKGACGGSGGGARGRLVTRDDRVILWTCRTKDGFDGTARIDDQSFDLAKGAVFLVSTNDKKPKVEQISTDVSKFEGAIGPQGPSMHEKLKALGDTEPQIAEFFRQSRAEEKPPDKDARTIDRTDLKSTIMGAIATLERGDHRTYLTEYIDPDDLKLMLAAQTIDQAVEEAEKEYAEDPTPWKDLVALLRAMLELDPKADKDRGVIYFEPKDLPENVGRRDLAKTLGFRTINGKFHLSVKKRRQPDPDDKE